MKCPECGFQLAGQESVCPRCLTALSYAANGQPITSAGRGTLPSSPAEAQEPQRLSSPPAFIPRETKSPLQASKARKATPSRTATSSLQQDSSGRLEWRLIAVLGIVAVTALIVLIILATRHSAAAYLKQAQDYQQNGQYEHALLAYLHVLEKEDGSAVAHNGAGWCYLQLGRPAEAIAHLRRAAEADTRLVEAQRGLGIAYSQVAMYPEAEASLKRAWESRDMQAGSYLGYVYVQEQRYDEAIAILQTVTQSQPQNMLAQEYLGRAFYAMKRYEEALPPLQVAVEHMSGAAVTFTAREYLGLANMALNRCDQAMEQFQALLAVAPQKPAWYSFMGQCLLKEGKLDQAAAYLNHALVLAQADPILHDSHLYLAQVYSAQGRYDEAAIMFRRALLTNPNGAEAMAGLGWCYVAQKDCESARPLFEQALTIASDLKLAQEGLATCPAPKK